MIELKSCPCCGGKARLWVNNGVCVRCTRCPMQTGYRIDNPGTVFSSDTKTSVEQVVEAWNRRVDNGGIC